MALSTDGTVPPSTKGTRFYDYNPIKEFVVCHNLREEDIINEMGINAAGRVGRRIVYKELVSGKDSRLNLDFINIDWRS